MSLTGIKAGFALTGSFCTFSAVLPEMKKLQDEGAVITPIFSENAASIDTRFGKAEDIISEVEEITSKKVLKTISEVESIGPQKLIDLLIVAPCTGNTLAKIAAGVTDSAVTMAVKAHLRNGRPVLLAVSTNDGLATGCKNIAELLNRKNIFFVPFGQDEPYKKPTSLVADMTQIIPAARAALLNTQIQPVLV